jgi:hypothetical protein
VAEDSDQWKAVVNMVINLWVFEEHADFIFRAMFFRNGGQLEA